MDGVQEQFREPTPNAFAMLKAVVAAWEALPGGRNYSHREVQQWLIDDMKPAINDARDLISRTES